MNTKTITLTVLALAAVGAGGYGGYRLGLERGVSAGGPAGASAPAGAPGAGAGTGAASTAAPGAGTSAGPQKAGDVDPSSGRRVLYWHDPMVPGQRFDKPGKSPFMDMQLVPVYADAPTDTGGVSISSRVQQNLGVRTAPVARGSLQRRLEAAGAVAWNERDVAVVTARTGGFVERLFVRAPLDPVSRGQPLAEIYAPDWVAVQEEYLSVRRMQAAGTDALLAAARQRMLLAGMTEEQVRGVESSGRVQPRFTLSAPIGGVIAELGVREGTTVMAGAMLFRINGLSSVWVNAEIPEASAALVRPGAPVEARTPAMPEHLFKGRVAAIVPDLNPATRTVKARVEIANPGGRLTPGMYVTVSLQPPGTGEVLLVPSEAVIPTGERKVVILALDGGRFQPVDVETGAEAQGQTEIRKGLSLGQKVVVSGQFLIDSEASLKASATRMADPATGGAAAPAGAGAETGADKGADKGAGAQKGAGADKGATAPAGPVHRAEGVVQDVDAESALIKHGAIATAGMGAMTMEFKAPATGMPAGVRKGQNVRFAFQITPAGEFRLVSIEPAAAAASAPFQCELPVRAPGWQEFLPGSGR